MYHGEPLLFSLDSGSDFLERVAAGLGVEPGAHEERDFDDGEHKIRPLHSVRDRDVYVVQSVYAHGRLGLNDILVRLLFLLAALRGAGRLTAVVPYLCYARKDRRTKARDPLTSRYVAQLFEAVGIDRMVTLDVHNPAAFENAFRCRAEHVTAHPALIEFYLPRLQGRSVVVASPDVGGIKRAQRFAEILEPRLGESPGHAFMEKQRSEGRISGTAVVGEVSGRTVLILDDLIAGGGTMQRAAHAFLLRGAQEVLALATHAVFAPTAGETLAAPELTRIGVSNTLPPQPAHGALRDKLDVIDVAPLVAQVIGRLHDGGSLSALAQ